MKCIICEKGIGESKFPRVTCNNEECIHSFMKAKQFSARPKSFGNAYYTQKKRVNRMINKISSGEGAEIFHCINCGAPFYRTGTQQFCSSTNPLSNCASEYKERQLKEGYNRDYSQITPELLRELYYSKGMGSDSIAEWMKENKKILVSGNTIRRFLKENNLTPVGKRSFKEDN